MADAAPDGGAGGDAGGRRLSGPAAAGAEWGGGSRRPAAVPTWLFALCALALAVPVWAGSFFPTEDGPAHVYWTAVYRALANPASPLAAFYERSVQWNAPNLSYFALQYALSAVMEPHVAQRVIVTAMLVAWAAGVRLVSVAANGRLTLGALAALLLFHSWLLYVGLLSYLIGATTVVIAAGLLLRLVGARPAAAAPRPAAAAAALAALGVVAYYSHVVTGALFVGLTLLAALLAWRSARPRLAAALAAAALPTALLGVSYVAGNSFGEGGAVWAPFLNTVKHFVGLGFWRGFYAHDAAYFASLAALLVVLAALCGGAVRALRGGGTPLAWRAALVAAATLAALYFVAPRDVGQGWFVRERIQLVFWGLLLPALGAGVSGRAARVVGAAVVALVAWQVANTTWRIRRLDAAYDQAVRGAAAVAPGSVFRFVDAYDGDEFDRTWVHPLMEAGTDVALRRGAVLVGAHHPGTPFYWVRQRADAPAPALVVTLRHHAGAAAPPAAAASPPLSLLVQPAAATQAAAATAPAGRGAR